jgi:hypothetical protein
MRLSPIIPTILTLGLAISARATVVALWTFETAPPMASNQAVYPGILPESGSGVASGVHAGSGTDWTNPEGNGSSESFNANTWAIGDYFQFQTALAGYESVSLSWSQKSSGTGPKSFSLLWSTDGAVFTPFSSYSVGTNSWFISTADPASTYNVDLSSIAALDGAATGYFRVMSDVTVAAGGSSRLDDFQIGATERITPVPEVATVGALGFAVIVLGAGWCRRCG